MPAGNPHPAPLFEVVLYEPEIPPNTGNIIRLCANTGCRLHLVRPLGFSLQDSQLRRAGLDYASSRRWSAARGLAQLPGVSCGTAAVRPEHSRGVALRPGSYRAGDASSSGRRRAGCPTPVLDEFASEQRIRDTDGRLAAAASICRTRPRLSIYEAWRQSGFGAALGTVSPVLTSLLARHQFLDTSRAASGSSSTRHTARGNGHLDTELEPRAAPTSRAVNHALGDVTEPRKHRRQRLAVRKRQPDPAVAREIAGAGEHQVADAGESHERFRPAAERDAERVISASPRVISAARAFAPSRRPSLTPAAIAMTFFTAPPTSTPVTVIARVDAQAPGNAALARSRAARACAEASVSAAGSPRATSGAKLGPDSTRARRRPAASSWAHIWCGSNAALGLEALAEPDERSAAVRPADAAQDLAQAVGRDRHEHEPGRHSARRERFSSSATAGGRSNPGR